MSHPIIQIENIGKAYLLGQADVKHAMFRDVLLDMIKAPYRRLKELREPAKDRDLFWALRNVSFNIRHGEVVGIIGRNGAGKSTLLKILSRITEPSEGQVTLRGRVGSLLEVGTGFHPELTGRENVYLNGAILGMSRSEIDRKFDEIVQFAEVEKFLDTPIKRFSSGMYVRLAFSVAAHLEPEILIVDEVLAVGDAGFQKKCLGKMGEVSKRGRTILFVSHNMAAVRQLTSRCVLLERGNMSFDGDSARAIERYLDTASSAFVQGAELTEWPRFISDIGREVEFKALSFDRRHPIYGPDEPVVFDVRAKARQSVERIRISGTIFHAEGTPVGTFFSNESWSMQAGEERVFRVALPGLQLAPGGYQFGLALGRGNEKTSRIEFDILMDVLPFEVGALDGDGGTVGAWHRSWGSVRFPAPLVKEVSNI